MLALAQAQAHLKDRLQRSRTRSPSARLLVDYAVGRPTFTVREAAEAIGLQYQGTNKLVDALVELGILAEYGERSYNRRFHAPVVLEILLRESSR
jgi:Fic family protein